MTTTRVTPDEARRRLKQATAGLPAAQSHRDDAIRAAFAAGLGGTEIAAITGLTRSRVYQIRGDAQ